MVTATMISYFSTILNRPSIVYTAARNKTILIIIMSEHKFLVSTIRNTNKPISQNIKTTWLHRVQRKNRKVRIISRNISKELINNTGSWHLILLTRVLIYNQTEQSLSILKSRTNIRRNIVNRKAKSNINIEVLKSNLVTNKLSIGKASRVINYVNQIKWVQRTECSKIARTYLRRCVKLLDFARNLARYLAR